METTDSFETSATPGYTVSLFIIIFIYFNRKWGFYPVTVALH
jgi:hypothetical protein